MKSKVGLVLVVVLALTMGWGLSVLAPAQSQASNVVAVEGAKFDTALSLADNLKSFAGKMVSVHLKTGGTLQGIVKSVGQDLVHLEKLAGKEYFDALIPIDAIGAVEARFREVK
jgi:predicted outer membrane protein